MAFWDRGRAWFEFLAAAFTFLVAIKDWWDRLCEEEE